MPTPEEMAAAMASVLENKQEPEPKEPETSDVITDKAEIEAALADTVEELPVDDSLLDLMNRASNILKEYNGVVADIPRSSEYQSLMNRINTLRNP